MLFQPKAVVVGYENIIWKSILNPPLNSLRKLFTWVIKISWKLLFTSLRNNSAFKIQKKYMYMKFGFPGGIDSQLIARKEHKSWCWHYSYTSVLPISHLSLRLIFIVYMIWLIKLIKPHQ